MIPTKSTGQGRFLARLLFQLNTEELLRVYHVNPLALVGKLLSHFLTSGKEAAVACEEPENAVRFILTD